MLKIIILIIVIIIGLSLCSDNAEEHEEQTNDKLEVKIYYEALCGDSRVFFRRKLFRSLITNNRLQNTELKLIPYGKVEKYLNPFTNQTELNCQHGPLECEQNALHACIIENNSVSESLLVINCLMNSYNTNIDSCATQYNVNVDKAKTCTKLRTTLEILEIYGRQTGIIDISFVPSIEIDGVFDQNEQYRLRNSFDSMFCRKFTNKFNHTLQGCAYQ